MMRKKIAAIAPPWILLAALGIAGQEVIEEIVAIVNDDIITLSQYRHYHDSMYQMLRAQLQGEEFDKQYSRAKEGIMDAMVMDLLLLQLARQKQLNVNEQIKNTVESIRKENNFESDAQLREELRRQGMSYEEFIKGIEEDLLRQAVVFTEVDRGIVLDESETVNYYKSHQSEFVEPEEYKLRAVYLSLEGGTEEELEAKRKEISAKIAAGGDFAAVAGETSDSPLRENQGDLGTIKQGHLDKTLEDAVVKLKPGEASPWVQAKNGWYLLKLEEKKESRLLTFEEAKRKIEDKIFQQKRQKKLDEFLKDLKGKSYIKILKQNPLDRGGDEV
jgi:parvulin-like peptidyl-prolyl isomerase